MNIATLPLPPVWQSLDSVVLTLAANEQASVSSFIPPGKQYKVELGSTTNLVQERWIELV